ncbi:MAG: decaprenyl-phosphate phosphoribosyltransferase [Candidatus Microgenomates bacterium]|jgi:4-hydroxybenzoate polyprenyltransferase
MANLQAEKPERTKDNLIIAAFKAMRPVHWIKNISLFAAIFLTGFLFDQGQFTKVLWAFVAFCLTTSATYVFNDILDIKSDKLHPMKKFRPVASGALPVRVAVVESAILIIASILIAVAGGLNSLFITILIAYLVMQFFYSLGLKNVAIIDIIIIAAGFVFRVYAGAFAIDAHLSVWFLLCVISAALFLASGKRRAEINIAENLDFGTRKSLGTYKKELLNSYVTMFGNASWMSWALFTFFESPRASVPFWLVLAEISKTTTITKLLMLTIPVTIFGVMRYESLIFEGKTETPEKLLLTDKMLIATVLIWIGLIYWVLYGGIAAI